MSDFIQKEQSHVRLALVTIPHMRIYKRVVLVVCESPVHPDCFEVTRFDSLAYPGYILDSEDGCCNVINKSWLRWIDEDA